MSLKADFKILDNSILLTKWHKKKLLLDEVKEVMEEMLVVMGANNIKKYIDDISECDVDWEEADKWIILDWYPRALKLGVIKNALIVAPGIVMGHRDEQCEIRSFQSFSLAYWWIQSDIGYSRRTFGFLFLALKSVVLTTQIHLHIIVYRVFSNQLF